jgi:circadian clock protein KaiB
VKKKNIDNSEITERFSLQLYVSGMSAKSMAAIKNIKHLCDNYIKDRFELEIIDIYKTPEAAQENQVVFSPSLVKSFPLPKKILIGTFADTEKVIKSLNLIP